LKIKVRSAAPNQSISSICTSRFFMNLPNPPKNDCIQVLPTLLKFP
jgi:hypothetical protein